MIYSFTNQLFACISLTFYVICLVRYIHIVTNCCCAVFCWFRGSFHCCFAVVCARGGNFCNLMLSVNYRPQRSCGKVIFLHLSLILFTGGVSIPACTTGHMTRGVSVQGGLCPVGISDQGIFVRGDLCPGGLCLGGISVQGESLLGRPPGQRPSVW